MTTVAPYGVRALLAALAVLASACGSLGDRLDAQPETEAAPAGQQLTGPAGEPLGVPRCGTERWSIKIGTDPAAGHVAVTSPKPNTVQALAALPAPHVLPPDSRIEPAEDQTWTVTATVAKVKLESDRDYHLVLTDPTGKTMIAEIPDPACLPSSDPWRPAITTARGQLDSYHPNSLSWTRVNRKAAVTGVEFFDQLHGQTGVAPNAIELHPVLKVEFLP